MPNDQLFLLQASFADPTVGPGTYHCPECARVEGLLSYFPRLRTQLTVSYIDFPRPRAPLTELLGEAHQDCPALVVRNATDAYPQPLRVSRTTGLSYCTGADEITAYLSAVYGVSAPHP